MPSCFPSIQYHMFHSSLKTLELCYLVLPLPIPHSFDTKQSVTPGPAIWLAVLHEYTIDLAQICTLNLKDIQIRVLGPILNMSAVDICQERWSNFWKFWTMCDMVFLLQLKWYKDWICFKCTRKANCDECDWNLNGHSMVTGGWMQSSSGSLEVF